MSEETDSRLPLRSWTLKNFKSVRDASIDFRPLTLLVGANSSGKSTVLQSILLVVQSVQSGASSGAFGLNGQLVNLGIYDDVRTSNSRGGTHLGGSLELPMSGPPSDAGSGHFTRLAWDVKLALAGKSASGAVLVRSVDVDATTSPQQGERRYELRLTKSAQDTVSVASWPEDLGDLGDPYTFAADLRLLPGYEGKAARARREPEYERLGGAKYSGVFPTEVAATEPAIQSAVRHWIEYAANEEWNLCPNEDEWLDGAPFGAPWSPSDLSGTLEEVVSCLTESLGKHRSAAGGNPDWPRRLVDNLSLIANIVMGVQGWTDVDDPTLKLFCALICRQNVAGLEAEAARGQPVLDSAGKPVDRWHYEPGSPLEKEWLDLGTAFHRLLTQSADEICAAVAAQFPDAGQAHFDAGPHAAFLMKCSSSLADFFARDVCYLGPLREDPHPVNRRSLVPGSSDLGTKGEYMTAVLLDHADDVWGELDGMEVTLLEAVKDWLRFFFQIPVDIDLKETSLGPELRIKDRPDGKWLHLTHVGVGVSQLLPVIVLCLLADEGSVIMLEQPELHLHPALQQRLGDFLLACANSGRQLIVETHSEHIVSRLRRRIAAAPDDSLVSTVEILFAEKNDRGDTHFRPVRANEYGGIEEWPEGFFDQSASEAQEILRAAIKKRKAVANKPAESSEERSDT